MAANLAPQYLQAEARYGAVCTPDEQLAGLEKMWRELLAGRVRSARIWGRGVADGQNVQLDHVLHGRDVVELHT